MDAFLEALRDACGSARWSQGVRLARERAVRLLEDSENALRFRVVTRGGLVSPEVTLYPDDPDWFCECGSPADACEHVAAAAIAHARGELSDEGPVEGAARRAAGASIAYRLAPNERGVAVRRVVRTAQGEQPLEGRLTAIADGRADGPRFVATPADLEIETLLAGRSGSVPRALLERFYGALAKIQDVKLADRDVRVSGEPLLPAVFVERRPEGFLVQARTSAGLEKIFPGGSALVEGVLRPVGDPGLTAREREELAEGRLYAHTEAGRLFGEILPRLRKRLPVEGDDAGLPELDARARARVAFDLELSGDDLEVRAQVVYGDPPIARVATSGRLELLGSRVPQRDSSAEARLTRELSTRLGLVPGERARFQGDAALATIDALEAWVPAALSGALREAFRVVGDVVPRRVQEGAGDDLPIAFAPAGGPSAGEPAAAASASRALAAWERGERHVRLSDGSWGRLPLAWLEAHAPLVRDLLSAREVAGALPRSTLPDQARLAALVGLDLEPAKAALSKRLEAGIAASGSGPLPAPPGLPLRDYQLEGSRWLGGLCEVGLGALLADDMGLGKTVQAASRLVPASLVACPTSVLHNWISELARFRPDLSVSLYHGPARELVASDVVVTSHALVRMDLERLSRRDWKLFVFDESQALKNPESQLARAACALNADARIALSGTPVENRLQELWSQMHFLNPGLLGTRRSFDAAYAQPIASGDDDAAARLRRRIAPFILRRRKSDVAPELPARTEIVLRCALDERERAVYDALRAATRKDVVERVKAGGSVLQALEALLRLRQAACHSALVPGQQADSSSKVDLLLDRLEEVASEGRRALVFSQWTSLLDLIEPGLESRELRFERLDGSTRDRAGVVARFQDEGSDTSLLLISLKAGGAGLNLTAADHVFLVDPWWNPASEDQAADRAHRIGQSRPVFIYRLVAENTVEERILALQEKKRRLAGAALSEASSAVGLDRSDVIALLED